MNDFGSLIYKLYNCGTISVASEAIEIDQKLKHYHAETFDP